MKWINIALAAILLILAPITFAISSADIDGNGIVNILDFNILSSNFGKTDATLNKKADINQDNIVNILDYNLLLSDFGKTVDTSPIQSTTPVAQTNGIWISKEEIMRLPTSGSAWDRVLIAANSDWKSACLYDNNCPHDVLTLAGALVATRTNNSSMREKVIVGLKSAMDSSLARALELSRGLQTYIIAADIIDYQDQDFKNWVRQMLNANISGHSGTGVLGTAYNASNNWGGHARASVASAAVYLKDDVMLQKVTTAHKAFIGLPAPGNTMVYNSTTWHADSNNKAGVNRKNSIRDGQNISGALPEDWRRASFNFVWPPTTTGYMWEGMQGYVVTSVILHRAGIVPFSASDNSVTRSMDILYGKGEASSNNPVYFNPANSDDTWIPWVVNYYIGENRYPTQSANPGKNIGWTDWTHAR